MSETIVTKNNSLDDNLSSTEPTVESNQNSTADMKDNGADEVEESSPNKRIKLSNDSNDVPKDATPAPTGRPGRPSKSAKRLNILEKTAKEGEALLQNLGHKADENPEGRRQTRSQTRGTPAVAAPTPKKSAPKSPQKDNSNSGTPKRRGRPPKNSITNNSVEKKTEPKPKSEKKSELQSKPEAADDSDEAIDSDKAINNSNETNNKTTTDGNESNDDSEVRQTKPESDGAVDNEQTSHELNENISKHNSISDETSKSLPVIDKQTQQQTQSTAQTAD